MLTWTLRTLFALSLLSAAACGPAVATGDTPDAAADAAVEADVPPVDAPPVAEDTGDPCNVWGSGRYQQILCNGVCTRVDANNCGVCGRVCGQYQTCLIEPLHAWWSRCGYSGP